MQKFNFAQRLAALAAEADDFDKEMLNPHERRQLELCRDVMHTTAQELAGTRVGELYDAEEISAEELGWPPVSAPEILRTVLIARVSGTQAAGLLPVEPQEVYSPHTLIIEQRAAA